MSVAAASAAAAVSSGSTGQPAGAGAEDSAASAAAPAAGGGRVEEFTAAQRAQRGNAGAAALADAEPADAPMEEEEQEEPPTELELRCGREPVAGRVLGADAMPAALLPCLTAVSDFLCAPPACSLPIVCEAPADATALPAAQEAELLVAISAALPGA